MRCCAVIRPLVVAVVLAAFLWIIVSGCGEEYRTDFHPIQVAQVEFPDSILVGQADSMVVLAIVGYSGCTLGEVSLARSGDSLVVSGTFSCRYRVDSPYKPGGIRITTPPASPIEARAVISLPNLEPGTYRVVAELWSGARLADTLVVAAHAPRTREWRLAGFGHLYYHSNSACAATPVAYQSQFSEWPRKPSLVENPPAPVEPGPFEINATILGPASCDSSFATVLRLRSAVPR